MSEHQTITEIAEHFGLVVETAAALPGDERSFRIYKGANQIYTGNEENVRGFLVKYERQRPPLFHEATFAYKE